MKGFVLRELTGTTYPPKLSTGHVFMTSELKVKGGLLLGQLSKDGLASVFELTRCLCEGYPQPGWCTGITGVVPEDFQD